MRELGGKPTKKELKKFVKDIDKDGNGKIDWPEFLEFASRTLQQDAEAEKEKKEELAKAVEEDKKANAVAKSLGLSKEQVAEIKAAFDLFDKNGDGTITKKELRSAVRELGEQPTKQELQDFVKDVDKDGNCKIDFPEFLDFTGRLMQVKPAEKEKKKKEEEKKDPGPQLTKEQLAEIKEAFDMFDKNKDGSITTKELGKAMRELGAKPTKKELKKFIKDIDKDGNGKIEWAEFLEFSTRTLQQDAEEKKDGAAAPKLPPEKEAEIREAFNLFDKNGDGTINTKELSAVMEELGQKPTKKELKDFMKEVDKDGSGTIDFSEFLEFTSPIVHKG